MTKSKTPIFWSCRAAAIPEAPAPRMMTLLRRSSQHASFNDTKMSKTAISQEFMTQRNKTQVAPIMAFW